MGKTQLNVRQRRREQLKNNSVNFDNLLNKNESSSTAFNSSTESLSSDSENTFKPFPLPILKQNHPHFRPVHQQGNNPVKTASKNKERPFNFPLNEQKFPKRLTSSATQTVLSSGNQSPIAFYLIPSDQADCAVHRFCEQPEYHFKSVSRSESLSCASCSKSMRFQESFKPSYHTTNAFNDPKSYNYEMKTCSDNIYEGEKQQTVSSSTHKLILDFIRNCQTPLNIYRSLECPPISCKCKPCSHLLNIPTSQSILKNPSSSAEIEHFSTVSRSINQYSTSPYPLFSISPIETETFSSLSSTASPITSQDVSSIDGSCPSLCSTGSDVESLETTPRNMSSTPSKAEPISNEQSYGHLNGSIQPNSLHFLYETENINRSSICPRISDNISLKRICTCCNSTLERDNSTSSTVVKVGCMENMPENKTILLSKMKPISDTSPGSPIIHTTTKERWHIHDGSKSNKQDFRCPHDSYYPTSNGNNTYSKSVTEKNDRNDAVLENENSSKSSSVSRVKKQGTLQLARDKPPSSTSISPFILNSSKHIQNATVNISQPFSYSAKFDRHSITRCSNDSRVTDSFLEENGCSTLERNDPLLVPFLYPEETFSLHDETPFAPPNTPIPLSSSEEMCFIENTVFNKSRSLSYLSMMCGPQTTEASEESVLSDGTNSEHNARKRNKTKKSKFVSCFFACLRPSSSQ